MEADLDKQPAVAIRVAYDGAAFSGFARQPGLETVQGRIESALAVALRREVETTGAGRTDAGVHALGQVVSYDSAPGDVDLFRLRRSLDALVGEGISVKDVAYARPGFSARFDALRREYRYRVVAGNAAPLFLARYAWHVNKELDVGAMKAAAEVLVGEHDFRSFCMADSARGKRTVRRLEAVEIFGEEHLGEECLTVKVVGNAFLHSMVRIIVGSLVDVGVARRPAAWMSEALASCERTAAGQTAPALGLTLWSVDYPQDVWL